MMSRYAPSAFVVLLLLSAGSVSAQTEDFRAIAWRGGELSGRFELGSNLSGAGLAGATFGGVQSALLPVDGGALYSNPALLGLLAKPQLAIDGRLSLNNRLYGLRNESIVSGTSVRSRTDGFLSDLELPTTAQTRYTRTDNLTVGQPGQLAAFSIAWPVSRHLVLAAGYYQPFLASATLRASGSEIRLEGKRESGSRSIGVDALAGLSVDGTLRLEMSEASIGAGGLIEEYLEGSLFWGVSAQQFQVTTALNWNVVADAMVVLSGSQQFFFNDPLDPNIDTSAGESNLLSWLIRTNFRGTGRSARLGLAFRSYTGRFGASFSVNLAPTIWLEDRDAVAESYLPVFVNLSGSLNPGPGEEDLLNIEDLVVSKPNLTKRTHDAISTQMRFRTPSSYTLGLDFRWGRAVLAMNLIRYVGELSYGGEFGLTDGELQSFRIGKRPSYGFRVGLDFLGTNDRFEQSWWLTPLRFATLDIDGLLFQALGRWTRYRSAHYRFGGGLLNGRSVIRGISPSVAGDLSSLLDGPVPMNLSAGRTYQLFNAVDIGVMVYSVPDLLFRASMAINLK
jgi:hypothetical protein